MKHILLLVVTWTLLLSNNYAVQVIAVESEDSISSYFMRVAKGLENDAIKMSVIDEVTKNYDTPLKKIIFKEFHNKKSAIEFCKVAREKLLDDAFVREITTQTTTQVKVAKVKHKMAKVKHKVIKKYVSSREKKKIKRVNEIASAIAFYRNASGYHFKCGVTAKSSK